MKWLVIFFLTLSFGVAAVAQTRAVTMTPHQFRTMSTAELRAKFFDESAPQFVESWVEGPTRDSESLTIELATRSRSTGYSGLCTVQIGYAHGRWKIGEQTEDSPLDMYRGFVGQFFLLSSDDPSLDRDDHDGDCSKISALFSPRRPKLVFAKGVLQPDSDADTARFGFAVVAAARGAARGVPIRTERCLTGSTGNPNACDAPADYVRTLELRDVKSLVVGRCDGVEALCVDATIARRQCGYEWTPLCGEDHLVVETDVRSLADGTKPDHTRVKSILIRAGATPEI